LAIKGNNQRQPTKQQTENTNHQNPPEKRGGLVKSKGETVKHSSGSHFFFSSKK